MDPLGSFASKRKWDDKGAIRIAHSRSPRFASDSYLGEKPFLKDTLEPRPVPNPDFAHPRSPKHVFPGLKKKLDPKYLSDKKALLKDIIQGKQKVNRFKEFIETRALLSEPSAHRRHNQTISHF